MHHLIRPVPPGLGCIKMQVCIFLVSLKHPLLKYNLTHHAHAPANLNSKHSKYANVAESSMRALFLYNCTPNIRLNVDASVITI